MQDIYDEQRVSAQRELDGVCKGRLRWKVSNERQYLYHRISDNPLVEHSSCPQTWGQNAGQ
jgi:hypothetical protein